MSSQDCHVGITDGGHVSIIMTFIPSFMKIRQFFSQVTEGAYVGTNGYGKMMAPYRRRKVSYTLFSVFTFE
jgi:hypothetical protein